MSEQQFHDDDCNALYGRCNCRLSGKPAPPPRAQGAAPEAQRMSSTSLTLEEALRGWQECAAELARVRAERDHYLTALTGVVEQKEQQRVRAAKAEARLAALEATDGD